MLLYEIHKFDMVNLLPCHSVQEQMRESDETYLAISIIL